MKLMFVAGTRAETIKLAPLIRECAKQKIPYYFYATGQHDLDEICETFNIPKPSIYISDPSQEGSKYKGNTLQAIIDILWLPFKIRKRIHIVSPTHVIYHGDTMATCAAAVGSGLTLNLFWKKWKSVHVEAGLRSGSLKEPFPEEISRIIADGFSDINLNVNEYGNTIVDSVDYIMKKYNIKVRDDGYCLVSIHRHENIKSKERLAEIVEELCSWGVDCIWPMHNNTENQLKKFGLWEKVVKSGNIYVTKPESYPMFLKLLACCNNVVADGGSIQEECYLLDKPIHIFRKATERQNLLGPKQLLRWGKNLKMDSSQKDILGKVGVAKKMIDRLKNSSNINPIWFDDVGLWWKNDPDN